MARTLKAFSLLEIMLAVGLLSFAVLTMIGLYASSFKLLANGRDLTAATDVARAELTALQEVRFSDLPDTPTTYDGRVAGAVPQDFPPAPWPTTSVNKREFKVLVAVRPVGANCKELTVRVFWGPSGSVTLQTLAAP